MNFSWWDLVPSVVGAVIGAAAAAIPAYLLARKTSKETLERDRISRREAQRIATLRAFIKLQRLVNGAETLHRGIEGMIERAAASGGREMMLWQKVMPMVGFTGDIIRFEADEISIFVGRDSNYLNEIFLICERYASLQSGFIRYGERRSELTDQLPVQQMTGAVGTTLLTREETLRFAPRVVELENLIAEIRASAASDYAKALMLGESFGQKAQKYLNDPSFPVMQLDETRASRPGGIVETA